MGEHVVEADADDDEVEHEVHPDRDDRDADSLLKTPEKDRAKKPHQQQGHHDQGARRVSEGRGPERVLDDVGRGVGGRQGDGNHPAGRDEPEQAQHEELALPEREQLLQHSYGALPVGAPARDDPVHGQRPEEGEKHYEHGRDGGEDPRRREGYAGDVAERREVVHTGQTHYLPPRVLVGVALARPRALGLLYTVFEQPAGEAISGRRGWSRRLSHEIPVASDPPPILARLFRAPRHVARNPNSSTRPRTRTAKTMRRTTKVRPAPSCVDLFGPRPRRLFRRLAGCHPEPPNLTPAPLPAEGLGHQLRNLGRVGRSPDSGAAQGLALRLGRALAAGDDCPSVAHRLALGGREARYVGDDGLLHLLLHEPGGELLGVAPDLADHHDAVGLGILLEFAEDLDEVRADDRVAPYPDGRALAYPPLG